MKTAYSRLFEVKEDGYLRNGDNPKHIQSAPYETQPEVDIIIIIIIIIIFINCNWVDTRWQWLFYMYTKYDIDYY
jgi:hypothetical protein